MKVSTTAFRKLITLVYFASAVVSVGLMGLIAGDKIACAQQLTLIRGDATVLIEPYAPNVVRVSLSLRRDDALAAPGYGISATSSPSGWTAEKDKSGDVLRSSRMVVTVSPERGKWVPSGTQADIAKFFNGSTPGVSLSIRTPEGSSLLQMHGWQMSVPNHKDGNAAVLYDRRPSDPPFFQVGATFHSPADEHYYGLGQNQEGYLDRRGHSVQCAHDYNAPAGQSVCVPFIVTNYGYGLMWDNPSKTTVAFGFNDQTRWTSEVGQRVSFFIIAGKTYDEIYSGYRLLTGDTPMLPKGAYGFIQCKQRYVTQAEMLAVAKGYRERHLPIDVLVLDWFYYTGMGQMDFIKDRWPDPAEMNRQLHAMNIETMISVWPRFEKGTRFYDLVKSKGWFEHLADGTPTDGLPYDKAGSDIDTTNPDAAKWYWETVRDNIASKGFDSFWADETEPDLPPNGSYFHIGPGTQYFNVYPLFHTAALYNGIRKDLPQKRALIMSRDAYMGAQHNGAIFWSSDIYPTWDTLRRQIPTGLNVTASGIAYWGNDIGGWQYLPHSHTPAHTPLIDPSDARDNVHHNDDYPELYVRWFEFLPTFRTHGTRTFNEVWTYGKQAEPILSKYLRLRYELMPYIFSLGYATHETGSPFMRALWMDFPNDSKTADVGDEYMFGPAFLVAPVTEQGQTVKRVYLPAGIDWYNYWTGEKFTGGQTIEVQAPIDTLPLFVRAGSIVPLGSAVESTHEKQAIAKLKIYPGANGDFTLYNDDGQTYAYEKGESQITRLHWDQASGKLSQSGAKVEGALEVVP